jgi:acyl dehydratase
MSDQLRFDDVSEGQEIPPYSQKVTLMELNRFAGANDEYVLIHMDRDYAKNIAKFDDVIVMGNLKLAYIANALNDWSGEDAWIRKLSVEYRKPDLVNKTLTVKGKVTGKSQSNGDKLVELDVWVENEDGDVTTPGKAIVALP